MIKSGRRRISLCNGFDTEALDSLPTDCPVVTISEIKGVVGPGKVGMARNIERIGDREIYADVTSREDGEMYLVIMDGQFFVMVI